MDDKIYSIKGSEGRQIDVYEDKAVITCKPSFGALFSTVPFNNENTIYYKDCVGVQFKKSGFTVGHLQLETPSSQKGLRADNSFIFESMKVSNDKMEEVYQYILKRVEAVKNEKDENSKEKLSVADEIKKFKELLDMGAITQDEFEQKKKELLNL